MLCDTLCWNHEKSLFWKAYVLPQIFVIYVEQQYVLYLDQTAD